VSRKNSFVRWVNNAGLLREGVGWELTDDYETVMAVRAGGTFRFTRAADDLLDPEERLARLTAGVPMGRFAEASDEAAYITGVVLPVDGGLSL
jgi:NAD(P)-dependent dehydrogenase (short-subunit alcohol dehydrogenase family)